MSFPLVYSENIHELALPLGHRFPIAKYRMLYDRLTAEAPSRMRPAGQASWDDLALVHTEGYRRALVEGTLDAGAVRRLGFPYSSALVERGRYSVGGTLAALAWAIETGAAGHLAGGTHHAFADRGEGFCVFNDLAVATRVARRDHGVTRVAIVDLDVHQGNGTAAIFADDPDTFCASMHGARNYPFKKERSSLDVELPDRCEDATYLRRLDEVLDRVAAFRPELVLFQAGVDALSGDRLGRLSLSRDGLAERNRRVFAAARTLSVPIVATLGGGYHREIELSLACHLDVYRG